MVSIAMGVFVLVILYVLFWSVRNDKVDSVEEQRGLINMRDPAQPKKDPNKPRRRMMPRAQTGPPQKARGGQIRPGQQTRQPQGPQR